MSIMTEVNSCQMSTIRAKEDLNVQSFTRVGHVNGLNIDCTFIDGHKLMTCGVDYEVRVWPINDYEGYNHDPLDTFTITDATFAIVSNSTHFFIACEDSNCVKSISLTDEEKMTPNETIVCRFTSNATHLDISSDGQLLVASAADFTIKLINLENKDQKCFEGHEAPVLSVALDPKHEYIASSSCDGSVRIWNTDNKNCIHFWINCFPKSNDFENSQTLGRICWQPISGQLLAIPKLDRIDVYRRDSWNLIHTYKHEMLTKISIVSYSYDSNYLAVASADGIVMVWKADTHSNPEPLAIFFHKKSQIITNLKWNPNSCQQLCVCDRGGEFGVLTLQLSAKVDNELPKKVANNEIMLSQTEINDMFADLSDDDFGEQTKDKPIEDNNFELPKVEFNQKYCQKIDKCVEDINNGNEDNDEDIEDNEFDIGAIKSRYESQIFGQTSDEMPESKSRIDSRMSDKQEVEDHEQQPEELPPLRQEAFQPGSTPGHFEQRFMVWNSVGIVRCYNTETENSIDVEFHDVTYHHSIHLSNVQNYTIADLSADALILATNNDNSSNGKLFCKLFNIWDTNKEWEIEMPKEEYIEAITCGSGFMAVATDKRFIRVLTSGGIQTHIFSIAGPVVCLSSFQNLLMIIYHSASGLSEEQSLAMIVMRIEPKLRARHPVPNPVPVALSPKSSVSWAGFTDEGTPCVVDNDGIVRLFDTGAGNTWIPIVSTKEQTNGKSDNFFTIGLSEIQSQIRCIFCKGSRFPATVPKPTLTLLPLRLPLCEMNSTKGKYEEELMKNRMLSSLLKKLSKEGFDIDSNTEECNKNTISSFIKLFVLAMRANRDSLALEVSQMMPNRFTIESAIKIAEREKRQTLAMKLTELWDKTHDEDNEESDEELIEEYNSFERKTKSTENCNDFELKPKPLKKTIESHVCEDSNDSNDSIVDIQTTSTNGITLEEDEDSDSVSLKPKAVKILRHSNGNPFKVDSNESKYKNKRKIERESSDESDEESSDGQGFKRFYEELKQTIREDNSDVDEEELVNIAKERFTELDSSERKGWAKKGLKKRKQKSDNFDKMNDKSNKITKFFAKN